MTLKKFFSPENLSKLTKNLHTKAQLFFELEQTTPTPRTTDFASIPPKQLAFSYNKRSALKKQLPSL